MGDTIDISQTIVENGLELKKYREALGHEGPAFSCEIWHNGKKAALVTNSGEGGSNSYTPQEKGIVDLLTEIGKMDTEFEAEDHAVVQMLMIMDRKKQMARWAKKGLNFAVEVVFKESNWKADPPVLDDDIRMFASSTKPNMTAGLTKKKFLRARWINPDGSLGDEYEAAEAPKPVQLDMEAYARENRMVQSEIEIINRLIRSPDTGEQVKVFFIPLTATREPAGSITIAGPKYKATIGAKTVRFDEGWERLGKGNEKKELDVRSYISPCLMCGAVANVSTGRTRVGPELVRYWFKCVNCNKVYNEPVD